MQAIRACVAATVRRDLKEPVAPVKRSHEERVTFRWRRFLLLTFLVVTASTAQLCLMTQDEIRERKPRDAQETRNRLRSANQEQQVAGTKGKHRNQKPSPTVIPATIDRDLDPSKRPPTGGWVMRISFCPHLIEQRAFRENAYLEWMMCLSCGARWSRKTGRDDIQVKMGLTIDQPQVTPPCPGCASTTRLQQMANKTETFFGCSWFLLCKRVVHTSHTMESRVSPSTHSCSAAQPMAEQVMVLDSDSVGSEEIFTMLNVPSESAVTLQEQQFQMERPNVSRQTTECQGEQGSSDFARHDAEDLNITGVLQSVRVWTDKTDGNADAWETAIRHFNKIGTSSCFLMEIDRGCLQPLVFDDSIFGEYVGSFVKN